MERKPGHRPGDIILDRYVPHLGPLDREVARERLQGWMRWKLRIIMREVLEEQQCDDSRAGGEGGRMESSPPPTP